MKFHLPKEDAEAQEDTTFYPKLNAHIEIKSSTIPEKLCVLLLKQINAKAEAAAKTGIFHAASSFEFLNKVLSQNNLIPCWSEF
jgi:formate dehydrogenase assembly factor FdhD